MTLELYYIRDDDGQEVVCFDSYPEAKEYAIQHKQKVVCYEFEYSDSYVVDDFSPNVDPEIE